MTICSCDEAGECIGIGCEDERCHNYPFLNCPSMEFHGYTPEIPDLIPRSAS